MSEIKELPIYNIFPDPQQPRKTFDEDKIRELCDSIKEHGILQPILVRPIGKDKFQIVHGERRWRACKILGLLSIKAEVRNLDDKEVLEIQLVENLQREDLNPIEQAETYKRLIDDFGYTHEKIGIRIGKSREYVSNKLRLLNLPSDVRQKLIEGSITEGHAKAIVSLDSKEQEQVVKEVVEQNLRVRDTENLVRNLKQGNNVPRGTSEKTFLIPISSKTYSLLNEVAKRMKMKRELVIEQALISFSEGGD